MILSIVWQRLVEGASRNRDTVFAYVLNTQGARKAAKRSDGPGIHHIGPTFASLASGDVPIAPNRDRRCELVDPNEHGGQS